MVILLGGAPRAGKGIVSRELVRRHGLGLVSLDVLKMGLHRAVPSMGVDPNADSRDVGEAMEPLVHAMAENALESEVDLLFEGDMILPEQVAALQGTWGDRVASCFLGYRDIDPQRKLLDIRAHHGLGNDWLSEHSDAYVLDVVSFGVEYSGFLAEECARFGLTYIDGSDDFGAAVEASLAHLSPASGT